MSLIPIHTAELRIPELKLSHRASDGNEVSWLASPELRLHCKFFEHERKSLLIKTTSVPPWDEFFLKPPGCRAKLLECKPILHLREIVSNISSIGLETELFWSRYHPTNWLSSTSSPEDIVATWKQQFRFMESNETTGTPGLRRPQIGAIHAVASYLTIRPDQPVTVVMPTGTGKTEVMLSTLVCCQCPRVLILVPSDALRTQIVDKFVRLGCLPDIGVLPKQVVRPRVALIKRGIHDPEKCRALVANVNVLVALPESLKNFSPEAREVLVELCTHLFIDEAHHVAAPTWSQVRDMFTGKHIVQYTATPFRRDGKSLEGRVIFNYKLGDAQREGYFRHIRLRTVEEYSNIEADKNIASCAINLLRQDLQEEYDHLILARTNTINRAQEILPIYQRLAPDLTPVIVHSKTNSSDQANAFARLISRNSRIIVCVDMFGEGFDLPNLKIAAIHDHHKTLAVTLQFVGRFTRSARNVGDAAAVVNIAEPKAQDELQALFAEDADWDKILCRRSEDTISKEIALLSLVSNMGAQGDLAKQLSLWNLRPACSAIIYKTDCVAWMPQAFAGVLSEHPCLFWHALSQADGVLVVVVARSDEVKWGRYRDIRNQTFELMIAHWDHTRGALFLHCSDYNFFRSQRMAEALCGDATLPVTGNKLFRIFGGVELPMVRNLGASKAGSISFTMYFGPNVTEGLAQVEKSDYLLSNLTGWGYEQGIKVTWGCSQKKGKIWSVRGGPITEWIEWCRSAWDKITDSSLPETEIIQGFLRPEILKERYPVYPAFVQWGEQIAGADEEKVVISIGDQEFYTHQVDLEIPEYSIQGPLALRLRAETATCTYELRVADTLRLKYEYRLVDGPQAFIQKGQGKRLPFSEYMINDPVVFTYVDGAFSYNAYIVRVPDQRQPYDRQKLELQDWHNTNIRIESQGKQRLRNSIQYKLCQELLSSYTVVFDDDGSGEAADIVCIQHYAEERSIKLCLVHCKFSSEDTPGTRINDMYTLCGQGQKCVRWKHNGFNYLADHMKRREGQWQAEGATRFIKGDLHTLALLKKQARDSMIKLEVVLAQPGLSRAACSDQILELLGSTELYLKKTANANLKVVCSV